MTQNEAKTIRRDKFVKFHNELKSKQSDFLTRRDEELGEIAEEEGRIAEELQKLEAKAAVFKSNQTAILN